MRETNWIRRLGPAAALAASLIAHPAAAQDRPERADALHQLNASAAALTARVSRSVVQVLVTSYGPVDEKRGTDTDLVIGRQRSSGSGAAIADGGYIVTNAHVIANARRVEVVLPGRRSRSVDAKIVGVAKEIDLALLKIDDASLPPLPIADYGSLRQGELVFAFGSPEGLRNSVTMGVVSSVARQPDADNPLVYVQTDAPINHGNSGGPLVNVNGEIVGINTFILSQSGGSNGLGFAIPGALVQMAVPRLRDFGHLHRGELGILLQTITPALAGGLGLPQEWGAMISDVAPGSPAERAGIQVEDVVLAIDGEPVDGVPRLAFQLLTRGAGDVVRLKVRRRDGDFTTDVTVAERTRDFDRLTDRIEPERSLVPLLGILGVAITDQNMATVGGARVPSGVVVVGRTPDVAGAVDAGLMTADIIHSVNGTRVATVDDLRAAMAEMPARSAVALQIERNGQFLYLAFELD